MILIDADDVIRADLADHTAFQTEWVVGSPLAVEADYADVLSSGPFLLTVNDECAWAGQHADALYRVAEKRLDPPSHHRWQALFDIYAESVGVSRQSLLLRFVWVRRRLRGQIDWVPWDEVYHWTEGSDLVWSSLRHHPEIEPRVHNRERQVRYPE